MMLLIRGGARGPTMGRQLPQEIQYEVGNPASH
jgi:hypothetical protein